MESESGSSYISRSITCKSMAQMNPPFVLLLVVTSVLLPAAIQPSAALSFSFSQYKTAVSLSHSLLTRVSNLRAARGDVSGSNRAKLIAQQLERGLGLGFWGFAWSAGWDYLKNYSWRELDYREAFSAVSDLNELMQLLGELTRAESDTERAAWISRKYSNVLRVSKSVLYRLLKLFRQSGALREVVKTVETEVVEGGLLRDCLELGSNDLKGLLEIVKDMASQSYSNTDYTTRSDL
ncbi:hypothetical protein K2173_006555 [Erythroxylum novogranatense]|uniref:Uncharacterized protein n=1 Tax=Erythroxylum novogranatense TaxID=1862640 RepID=A0AAV8T5U3_9ROSI|nr:hypothetical protein K2173_006555 [Erythroxylum novogranatense]